MNKKLIFIMVFAILVSLLLFYFLYLRNLSVYHCKLIAEEKEKEKCYLKTGLTGCEFLNTWQTSSEGEDCFLSIALAKNDVSICERLKYETRKENCIRRFAVKEHDVTICEKRLKNESLDSCYWSFATTKLDLVFCDKISNTAKREGCRNNVYEWLAIQYEDEGYCKRITEEMRKYLCFDYMAGLKKDISICENIPEMPELPELRGLREGCRQTYMSRFPV